MHFEQTVKIARATALRFVGEIIPRRLRIPNRMDVWETLDPEDRGRAEELRREHRKLTCELAPAMDSRRFLPKPMYAISDAWVNVCVAPPSASKNTPALWSTVANRSGNTTRAESWNRGSTPSKGGSGSHHGSPVALGETHALFERQS